MSINPLDNEDRVAPVRETASIDDAAQAAQPTNAEIAAQTEANTKATEKTQVRSGSSGQGSIINDMA